MSMKLPILAGVAVVFVIIFIAASRRRRGR
jgi:hypothetical protein